MLDMIVLGKIIIFKLIEGCFSSALSDFRKVGGNWQHKPGILLSGCIFASLQVCLKGHNNNKRYLLFTRIILHDYNNIYNM